MPHTVQSEGAEPRTYLGFTHHPRSPQSSHPGSRIAVALFDGDLDVYCVDAGAIVGEVVAEITRYYRDDYSRGPDSVTVYSAEAPDTTIAETPAHRAGRVAQLQREVNDALGQLGAVAAALSAAGAPADLKLADQVGWLKARSSPHSWATATPQQILEDLRTISASDPGGPLQVVEGPEGVRVTLDARAVLAREP